MLKSSKSILYSLIISIIFYSCEKETSQPIKSKKIIKNNNTINIFFDKKTLNLIGWQTEDIYQNLVITYIYKIQYNQKVNKKIFKLPDRN